MIKELDRIEQIITGLLLFARPPQARPQPCDVHMVLARTLDLMELQLGDAQVTVARDYAGPSAGVGRSRPCSRCSSTSA